MKRIITDLCFLCFLFAGAAHGGTQDEEVLSGSVRGVLQRGISDQSSPKIVFASQSEADDWLNKMSSHVAKYIPEAGYRMAFLKTVHYEATREGLDPVLVLGLIEVESRFKKYAVSKAGAKGYMQVMPHWVNDIGAPEQNLFHLSTNLRYGCTILRYYLDMENGDLYRALERYNNDALGHNNDESLGNSNFPNRVRVAWHKYEDTPSIEPNTSIVSTAKPTTLPNGNPIKQSTGTAFLVSDEGHALTNHHVIKGCTEVKIAGREGIAKVITSDSINDLALLQLSGKFKNFAKLNSNLGKLRQGDNVIVFGYPLNSLLSSSGNLTLGNVSALTGLGNNPNQIQISAPIQPGSSGSPVLDTKGNVVGVVSSKLDDVKMAKATGSVGQNVNFAVNGKTVKAFLDANKVPYVIGGGLQSKETNNADIAEEARMWTVLVECWK